MADMAKVVIAGGTGSSARRWRATSTGGGTRLSCCRAGLPRAERSAGCSGTGEPSGLAVARAALGLGEFDLPPGVVAATAPNPVRNADLMAALRQRLAPRIAGRALGMPTPAPLLKIGAVALRTDAALALTGRRVTSEVLAGRHDFRFATLDEALDDVVS